MITTDSPRVEGSSPVEISFLRNLFFSNTILADLTIIYLWKNSNASNFFSNEVV